jgi:hypothetical protein
VIGAVLTVGINADTISVATALKQDSALRQVVAARATAVAAQSQSATPSGDASALADSLARELRELKGRGLPLGWSRVPDGKIPSKVLGLLLTTLALTLGAPFWFDMLSKVAAIRGAGGRPGTTAKAEEGKASGASGKP